MKYKCNREYIHIHLQKLDSFDAEPLGGSGKVRAAAALRGTCAELVVLVRPRPGDFVSGAKMLTDSVSPPKMEEFDAFIRQLFAS